MVERIDPIDRGLDQFDGCDLPGADEIGLSSCVEEGKLICTNEHAVTSEGLSGLTLWARDSISRTARSDPATADLNDQTTRLRNSSVVAIFAAVIS